MGENPSANNSLLQSIRDFFKKCLFSGWSCGGSDNVTRAELQRAKSEIQRYEQELEELKSKMESMHQRLYESNLNQFEFRNPRAVRGTAGTVEMDEYGSRTVKAWSMNRAESSSSRTIRAWSLNRRLSG